MSVQLGCHLSVSKGFAKAVERAHELGADLLQYFPKNPRSHRPKAVDREAMFRQSRRAREEGFLSVAHSPYVTNLATPDPDLAEITVTSIVNDLEIAEAYGTPYVVVHCGRHMDQGREAGIRRMVELLDRIHERYQGPAQLLLENTAGQGTELGTHFEELAEIRSRLAQPERVGYCIDTCHAFAAGILDFEAWDEFLALIQQDGFLEWVKVFHLNDSRFPQGSRRDRHAKLGQGEIGQANLTRFLTEPLFQSIPFILETPVEDELEYGDEMRLARTWVAQAQG
ncbi:deoxyribonuclease IV [Limnochorda pilosa]|uniref:deoxyribonuclease IV n=1 Tax=Limnochorda TaxID=1676651 RepID=UPI0026F1F750|nr:deoxyribonuclease IV [Limnochorda pilosa]